MVNTIYNILPRCLTNLLSRRSVRGASVAPFPGGFRIIVVTHVVARQSCGNLTTDNQKLSMLFTTSRNPSRPTGLVM